MCRASGGMLRGLCAACLNAHNSPGSRQLPICNNSGTPWHTTVDEQLYAFCCARARGLVQRIQRAASGSWAWTCALAATCYRRADGLRTRTKGSFVSCCRYCARSCTAWPHLVRLQHSPTPTERSLLGSQLRNRRTVFYRYVHPVTGRQDADGRACRFGLGIHTGSENGHALGLNLDLCASGPGDPAARC